MANTSLFASLVGRLIPTATIRNDEGAPAYAFTPKHALAQYAATGCLNTTFYADAAQQLETVLSLCTEVEPEFVAKAAIYCRERGRMKDMPALLCAYLAAFDTDLCRRVFPRVIDNGKMLRTFVQIIRSGVVGRKSFGTAPKRLVREWLDGRDDAAIFRSSVGNDPSMADVIKMVHPRPRTPSREALYGYLVGKEVPADALPEVVRQYEAFKAGRTKDVPDVPFEMLTSLEIGGDGWRSIARNASWQMTRMNLNTFARHGVFEDHGLTRAIAHRLADASLVRRAGVFPYQLMAAWYAAGDDVPAVVRNALQDALEVAVENVPQIEGAVYVCPDVSGSMQSPVTGVRRGATTAVRCVDVAALVAAAVVRKNPTAEVLPFENQVVSVSINARDSVMTNAARLAAIGGGGTNCSAPLAMLNQRKARGELVIFVSDNESWVDAHGRRGTETMREWSVFVERNPKAHLVCIDLQPYGTTQAAERGDILNVGGFSDQVFDVVAEFAAGRLGGGHWVGVVEEVKL